MRVNVIGYGTVGKAQEFLLKKLGHDVFAFDPCVFPDIKSPEKRVDMTFIRTPGDIVPDAIDSLLEQDVEGLYFKKSGQPFYGKCLPLYMITAFRSQGLNPWVFVAFKTYNLRIKNRYDNT
jgi:UDP-glucose 6-dehydrogenase